MGEDNNQDNQQLNTSLTNLEDKVLTMSELVAKVQDANPEDPSLPDDIRRFKLMLVKKSMADAFSMLESRALIQQTLIQKIQDDITIYPVNVLLDIIDKVDKIIDRNMAMLESLLPKSDSLAEFLASRSKNLTLINNVTMDRSPASIDRIAQVVEAVLMQLNQPSK